MAQERIQKILAHLGYGSRRSCEEYILAGRIVVNGKKVELGAKADPAVDTILLDQKPLPKMPENIYIALNKPRKVLSAINQDDDRSDVLQYIPQGMHVFPVGRLDYDSEGLILLTNDGEFSNKLSHPRYEHDKEYIVQVGSRPDDSQLEIWRRGVVLEDGHRTAPARVDVVETSPTGAVLRIVMHEGRKRQIRETGGRIGLPVLRIKRMRIGTVNLGSLKPGEWRNLTSAEVKSLYKMAKPEATKKPPYKSDNPDAKGAYPKTTASPAKPRKPYTRTTGSEKRPASTGVKRRPTSTRGTK